MTMDMTSPPLSLFEGFIALPSTNMLFSLISLLICDRVRLDRRWETAISALSPERSSGTRNTSKLSSFLFIDISLNTKQLLQVSVTSFYSLLDHPGSSSRDNTRNILIIPKHDGTNKLNHALRNGVV